MEIKHAKPSLGNKFKLGLKPVTLCVWPCGKQFMGLNPSGWTEPPRPIWIQLAIKGQRGKNKHFLYGFSLRKAPSSAGSKHSSSKMSFLHVFVCICVIICVNLHECMCATSCASILTDVARPSDVYVMLKLHRNLEQRAEQGDGVMENQVCGERTRVRRRDPNEKHEIGREDERTTWEKGEERIALFFLFEVGHRHKSDSEGSILFHYTVVDINATCLQWWTINKE